MLKNNFITQREEKAQNTIVDLTHNYQSFKLSRTARLFAAVFAVSFLILTIITSQYHGTQYIEAEILAQNFTQDDTIVTGGIEILKYDTRSTNDIDSKAEFDAGTYTNGNFETGEDDLEAVSDTDDHLTIEHYGDNAPDTSEIDWWNTPSIRTCSQDEFNNGTYNDTQWDSGNDWVELDSTGLTNGSGQYTSEIFDFGSSTAWNNITWTSNRPTYKELPNNKGEETAYNVGNIDMSGNVLLLHMNESSGTIADDSGEGNNGSYNGTGYNSTGRFNDGLDFDGSNDEITVPDDSSLDFATEITASIWVYFDSVSGWQSFFHKNTSSSSNNDLYLEQSGGVLYNYDTINTGSAVLTTGRWQHVVYTADASRERLYVDGQNVADEPSEYAGTVNANTLYIGGSGGGGEQIDGRMDEAALWNRALTPTEVNDIYRRGANRLKFQVRSCDDSACSGESFIGPDGTGSTYYTEEDNNMLGLPSLTLTNVLDNQYFQYRTDFETDENTTSPELSCASFNESTDSMLTYRRCFEIDHTDSDADDLEEYQIYLDIDTQTLVTDGKMQSDGDDIRFTDSNGNLLDYYIADDMNETSTRIWVQMDNIDEGETEDVCMYYGNSSASGVSSRKDVFTYSDQEKIYYVVADSAVDSNTSFVSYVDNNDVVVGAYDDTLNEFDYATHPTGSANYTQTTDFSVLGPIMGAFADEGTPPLVPKSAAGTDFVYRMDRYTNEFSIVSPWCNASIAMENGSGNAISGSPFSVSAGTALDVTTNDTSANGLPNNDVVIIEEVGSDCPVLITHHATGGQDTFVMYPANTEWYGVGSGALEIAAMEDATSITVYRSTGASSTYSLDRGEEVTINDPGSDGSDPAHRVVADKPVGAKSIGDSDGAESTTFLPSDEMDYKYYIPQDVQYITIATAEGVSTTVDMWEDGTSCGVGTADETATVTPSSNDPGKVYFGDTSEGLEYSAGACLIANNPIFVYYEYENTDDETNTWGMKQNRQYIYPEPTMTVGNIDTSTTWDLGESSPHAWNRRREITFTNNSSTALTDYQVAIDLDSYSDIFSNSQSDGGDLRVAGATGDGNDHADYWLESYDNSSTEGKIWIQFSSIDANSSASLYLYYAHTPSASSVSTTGSEAEVFTNDSLESVFYIVDSNSDDSNLNVISFVDNNEINDGYIAITLDEGDMETIPIAGATDIKQDRAYEVTGPLHIDFNLDATDAAVPISYAGREFVYNVGRYSDIFSFYAPFADASIQIQQSSGSGWTTLQTVTLSKGDATTVSQDIINGRAFKIVSDEDILAFHRNDSSDSIIMYPTRLGLEEDSGDYELYGIGSNTMRLASTSDANVTIYRSNGTSLSVTLNSGNNFVYSESGSGSQGTSRGYHIVSDAPIGAMAYADGDGVEAVTFVSQKEFSDTYVLADDAQYFAMVAKDASVTCRVYDAGGTEVTTDPTGNMDNIPPQTGGTQALPYVNNIHIGGDDTSDGAFFNAGYSMVCDEPVYAYYEHHLNTNITNETSWLTWPQVRKYTDVEPDVEDPDDVDEEGLYYESGKDSTTSGNDFEAYAQYTFDTSALTYGEHTYWRDITWEEIINSRSGINNIEQVSIEVASADPSPTCATATYGAYTTITPTILSTSTDSSLSYVDYITNTKQIIFGDDFSDHSCVRMRIYLRTGDQAYAPLVNKVETGYYVPTLLDDQLNNPTVSVVGATSSIGERYRILKTLTTDTNLNGSQVFTTYEGSSDESVFMQADLDLFEIPSQTINGQFAFPPFPPSPPVDAATRSSFDSSNDLAVYFTHERTIGALETMDFVFNVDIISAGGPQISRDFQLEISGL